MSAGELGSELEVLCGLALAEHYADNPHQTFHHEPSVAAVVLDAVPDGWTKRDGQWVPLEQVGIYWEEDGETPTGDASFDYEFVQVRDSRCEPFSQSDTPYVPVFRFRR